MRCFLVFLGLVLVTQEPIDGFKRPKGSKCKERIPVDVNDDWFFKFAKEGMDNPMGTRYSLKQGFSAPPMPDDDPTLKHKMCMTADFKVGLSTFPLTVVFRYNRINEFRAYVQTEGTPAEKAFKLYGDFVMAKTDNTSYILFFGCIFEAQEFWQVHTPTGTELSENATKAIYKHLKKMTSVQIKEISVARRTQFG